MNPTTAAQVTVTFLAAMVAFVIATLTWNRRATPGSRYFSLLMTSIAVFSLTNSLEAGAISYEAKVFWSKVSYLSVTTIAPFWLLFASSYSQNIQRWKRVQITFLWVIPLITLALAWTNEQHRLIWQSITPVSAEPGARLVYHHGLWLWLHAAYAYLLVLIGAFTIAQTGWRARALYRKQAVALVVAAFVPFLGNILYLFDLVPWQGLDLTPIAFLLAGIIVFFSLYRYRMLDLMPVAYKAVFASLLDGVIVLDTQNRIEDMNPTVRHWLGVGDEVIGKPLEDVLPSKEIIQRYANVHELHEKIRYTGNEGSVTFDMMISPLLDQRKRLQGRVIVLHDISQDERRSQQIEGIHALAQAALSAQTLQDSLQTLADRLGELFGAAGAYITLWEEEQQRVIPAAAYGSFREIYPKISVQPGEISMTASVLQSGKVLATEDTLHSSYISPRFAAMFPTRSILGVPLITGGRRLGAALIAYSEPHRFTPEEITLGELAGGQIAFALEKIRLYEESRRRASQLAALNAISQTVASFLDIQQVFKSVVERLREAFGFDGVHLYVLKGDVLHFGAQTGIFNWGGRPEIPTRIGVVGRAVRTRQIQVVPDTALDPDYLTDTAGIKSIVCFPLMHGEAVLGVLTVMSTEKGSFTPSDVNLVALFADQAAIAIANANLFEAERRQRQQAEALRDMAILLNQSLELPVLANLILEGIRRVIPYDSAAIMLVDEARQKVKTLCTAAYEPYGSEIAAAANQASFEIAATANLRTIYETAQPMIIPDITQAPEWIHSALSEHFHSWAGVPITIQGQVTAMIMLEKKEAGYFGPEHIDILKIFAAQAASAIQNAYLFGEVQKLSIQDELTGLYNRRGWFEIGRHEFEVTIRFVRPLAVLFVDIDFFKEINDQCGYAAGDQVLKQFARIVRKAFREVDLVGRFGGDEFIVLLPQTGLPAARVAAERLRCLVENQAFDLCSRMGHLTISVGIVQKRAEHASLEQMVEQAGTLVHEAKRQGRNRIAVK
ncbi:MAG TPA: histidine kinase N-terminal 7TM domain-containing protein [Anaerolineaceae bacterium]